LTQPASRPRFTGLLLHREPPLGYSFFVPDGWHRVDLLAEGASVRYAPSADDPFTGFSALGRDLGVEIAPRDLRDLRAGFLRGLRQAPRSRVKLLDAAAIGRLITLEAHHTYRDGENVRKRWVRLLYQGTVQVTLVAQAATVEAFDYWLPMFYESMRTFRFGDWALDAGVAAEDWRGGS
jgi:hypothetical protein